MFQTLIVGLCVVIVNGKNALPKMDIQQDFSPIHRRGRLLCFRLTTIAPTLMLIFEDYMGVMVSAKNVPAERIKDSQKLIFSTLNPS